MKLLIKENISTKEIKIWPATIFAVIRTDKVIGRINLLTTSIKTIKEDNIIGVPFGTKCLRIWTFFRVILNILIEIHNSSDKGRFKESCVVKEKEDGIKPPKFIKEKNKKIEINNFTLLFWFNEIILDTTSLLINLKTIIFNTLPPLVADCNRRTNKNNKNQNGKVKEAGSKAEKIFINIIFFEKFSFFLMLFYFLSTEHLEI